MRGVNCNVAEQRGRAGRIWVMGVRREEDQMSVKSKSGGSRRRGWVGIVVVESDVCCSNDWMSITIRKMENRSLTGADAWIYLNQSYESEDDRQLTSQWLLQA